MNIQGIEEKKGTNYISYTFLEYSMFDETGYRIVRSNVETGYLKCNKLLINGNMRIIYDVSNLYTLYSVAQLLSPNAFANLLLNIIDTLVEIKKNTFVHVENIDMQLDNIYVNASNLKPYFVYLPANTQSNIDGAQMMENYMKQGIQYIYQTCSNLQSDLSNNISMFLADYSNSLSDIKNKIANLMGLQSKKEINQQEIIETDTDVSDNKELIFNVIDKPSGKLKKRKNDKKKEKTSKNATLETSSTTVLKEEYTPEISLVGIGTPEKIELIVNKKEYIIGHKQELVDGYIGFNGSISRKHCKIVNIKGKNYISDLNSVNGTWINGKKLSAGKEVEITSGDKVKISNCEFMVTAIGKGRRKQK